MDEKASPDGAYQMAARQAARPAAPSDLLRLTVTSDSMRPLLRAGDEVVVDPIEPRALRPGMIIVVERHGDWITHRLVAIDEHGWHTHGDNTRTLDLPAQADEIIGRVIAIEQGAHTIDLQQPRWAAIERRINRAQRLQLALIGALRPRRGVLPNRLTRALAALVNWPFQLSVRLLTRW
jgi:signal peptidase I